MSIAPAQQPEPGEIRASTSAYRLRPAYAISVETKLVEVGVVVRDQNGRAVAGLTKDDFEITDEGKKRSIAAFAIEKSAPVSPSANQHESSVTSSTPAPAVPRRYVAILFDDVSMGPGEFPHAQAAAHRFVKEDLRAGDRVALFTISGTLSSPFSSDVTALNAAIDKVHPTNRPYSGGMCPHMTPTDAYGIANRIDVSALNAKMAEAAKCQNKPAPPEVINFSGGVVRSGRGGGGGAVQQLIQQVSAQADALWGQVREMSQNTLGAIQDVVEFMARAPENRMILLPSSGFLAGTLEDQMDDITRIALHAGVVINSLDAKGLYADEPLQLTGGMDARSITRLQLVGNTPKDMANDALASLAYNTGGLFFHNNNDLGAGFHELGMRPEVSYLLSFAPDDAPDGKFHKLKVRLKSAGRNSLQARMGYMAVPQTPPAPPRRLDTVAAGDDALNEMPGNMGTQPDPEEHGVTAVYHIDVKQLHFKDGFGSRQQQLSLIAVLLDSSGAFVVGKQSTLSLALKDATYSQIVPAGINLTLTVAAPPGSYKLRAIMGDGVDGKVSAANFPVEIR